jgi:hypothetical protein
MTDAVELIANGRIEHLGDYCNGISIALANME